MEGKTNIKEVREGIEDMRKRLDGLHDYL